MSYETEKMDALRIELRQFRGLKEQLEILNENIEVFERIASALERQNELKTIELGIPTKKIK